MFFAIAAALSVLSGVMQFGAHRAAGEQAKEAGKAQATLAEYEARATEIRASEERASSQRAAVEERRRGRFARSRLQSRAAASGALGPGVEGLEGELAEAIDYRALTALYRGEEMGRGLEREAVLKRSEGDLALWQGKAQQKISNAQANIALIGGIAGGVSSLAGGGYFDPTSATGGVPDPGPPRRRSGTTIAETTSPSSLYNKYAAPYGYTSADPLRYR